MKAFREIFLSTIRMFVRDRLTLLITIILPLLLGLFLGVVFSGSDSQEVRLLFVDEDHGDTVRFIIDGMKKGTEASPLHIKETTRADALIQLKEDKADGVLVFPMESSTTALGMGKSEIEVYFDPARVKSAISRLIAENIVGELNLAVIQGKKSFTIKEHAMGVAAVPLAKFFFPNTLAVSLLWLSLFATALPLVKQREKGALVQMKVTPLSPVTFMAGSILARLLIGVLQSGLFVAAGVIFLKVALLDRLPLFILAVILGNLTLVFMGYMIASISKNMQSADAISQLFNFGMMFLSGVFFTRDMLPSFLQKITYVIPLTYLADLFRQLMTGYAGMFPLWVDFAVLSGCAVLFAGIALRFFKLFSR